MKDTIMAYRKKKSHSSSDSSVSSEASNDSDQDSFPRTKSTVKTRSPETIELSSESDSSMTLVRKSRKKKKRKHTEDLDFQEHVQVIHSEHNGKRHRHRCHHHHHHHSHHRHHKYHHNSKDNEERVHKRTCSKHRMPLGIVKVKEEPVDEDVRSRHSHSSHRRRKRKRANSEDNHDSQLESHEPETSSKRSRPHNQRENSIHRKEEHGSRNEQESDNERQQEERRRSEEREREVSNNKNESRKTVPPRERQNRWGNEERNNFSTNRPIKQEPNDGEFEWGGRNPNGPKEEKKIPPGQKDKPNFGLSGKLAEDTNTFNGVVIKYSEPPEARRPKRRWRFYPFKGDQGLPTLYLHRQSSYLIGRDRKVADIPVDHPSCSKQHAALQYRLVPYEREDGTMGKRVRPYVIDLESANGTYVNSVKIEPRTYVELLEKDVVKFGYSSREYVLLHEQSKDEEQDDDVAGGGND